ncbi:MAG: hypothetical protein JHC19_07295 [Desulfurococcaceae archaeon]|nr:hypothetical protein [Desulfurococcaceae archaeon]
MSNIDLRVFLMILPHALIARTVEVIIKTLIAQRLYREGFSQLEIARILGVSQPTVNMYLKDPSYSQENMMKRLKEIGLDPREFNDFLEEIMFLIKRGLTEDVLRRLIIYSNSLLSSLKLCDYHKRIDPSVPRDCKICSELFLVSEDIQMIYDLEKAFEIISSIRGVGALIPEVGSNIAYAKRDAKDLGMILAYPGRIVSTGDYVAVVGRPRWGESGHLGRILLRIVGGGSKYRSVMNLRLHPCVEKWLHNKNISHAETGPHDRASIRDIEKIIGDTVLERNIFVIKDLGGPWIEPNIYIFAENPLKIAQYISEIISLC